MAEHNELWTNGYFTSFPTFPCAWGSWEGDLHGSSCEEMQKKCWFFFFTFLVFQLDVNLTSAGRPLNRQQAASSPRPPFNFEEKTIVNQRWVNTIGFKNLYQIFISNVDPKKVTLHFQMETFKNQSDLYKTLSLFAACWSPWTRPSHMEEGYGSRNSSWRVAFIWLAVYQRPSFCCSTKQQLLEFLSPELSNHLAELCTLMILRCSLLLRIWKKSRMPFSK